MQNLATVEATLQAAPRRFLVTGGAGFIGSHLVERLLGLGQEVTVLDDLSTGKRSNLPEHPRLTFLEGSVADEAMAARACAGVSVVLHQAALGSIPRSIAEPWRVHTANVDGFLRMLLAARDAGAARFVYASSSSVYGDEPGLPKVEDKVGRVLSPYAATKAINEVYAGVFQRTYGLTCVGLRYFNVFGARQDPNGAYAAVIPRWVSSMLRGEPCEINGDGETSRDFCAVANAVQANLLAALAPDASTDAVYNVAVGARTTLRELHALLAAGVQQRAGKPIVEPVARPFRQGDVRHSLANIDAARTRLGYAPTHDVRQGLDAALDWYVAQA
jgi:UDP-N-acetylglucosamine 4-epimerase